MKKIFYIFFLLFLHSLKNSSLPIKSKKKINPINLVMKYSSIWNWSPLSVQEYFLNLKKKNSFTNKFIHYGTLLSPFIYLSYQLKKSINKKYKSNYSLLKLFFNYTEEDQNKTKTDFDTLLILFFEKDEDVLNYILEKMNEKIILVLNEKTQRNIFKNIFYKKIFYMKNFIYSIPFLQINTFSFETLLLEFEEIIYYLKNIYYFKELEIEAIANAIEKKEALEKKIIEMYLIIEKIKNIFPDINFLVNDINFSIQEQIKNKKLDSKEEAKYKNSVEEFYKQIRKTVKEFPEEIKDQSNWIKGLKENSSDKIKQLTNLISFKENRGKKNKESFLDFSIDDFKKNIFINFGKIPETEKLGDTVKSRIEKFNSFINNKYFSNIFTLSLLTLNIYPFFYFLNPISKIKENFKNKILFNQRTNPFHNLKFL